MSVSSKVIRAALRVPALFNSYEADADVILEKAKKYNEKQHFELPHDTKFEYRDMEIRTQNGAYHCLCMKKPGSNPPRAVIYIPGGGAVYDYAKGQLFVAKTFLKHVDAEVFYPFYPPTTACSLRETYAMIFECYRAALSEYGAEKCAVVGVSSGATASMVMLSWNNYFDAGLAMPALTVALSPGHVPANGREEEMLEAYRGVDPMVPVGFVRTYGQINGGFDDVPGWMLHSAHGDFRNEGKIMLNWGEKETLAFSAPLYEQALKEAGADYSIHIEPDMPHTYACMRVNKACRDYYDKYVKAINAL